MSTNCCKIILPSLDKYPLFHPYNILTLFYTFRSQKKKKCIPTTPNGMTKYVTKFIGQKSFNLIAASFLGIKYTYVDLSAHLQILSHKIHQRLKTSSSMHSKFPGHTSQSKRPSSLPPPQKVFLIPLRKAHHLFHDPFL